MKGSAVDFLVPAANWAPNASATHPERVASTRSSRRAEPRSLAGPTRFRRQSKDAYSTFPGLGTAERDWRVNSRRLFLLPVQLSPVPSKRGAERSIGFESAHSGFQDADERQVAVPLLVVEPVTDDELILDIESDVVCFNRQASLFDFPQKDTAFYT
jgi:hypothetical protein